MIAGPRLFAPLLVVAAAACAAPEPPTLGADAYERYERALRAAGDLRTERAPADAPYTNDDLVRNFHRIALHTEADILQAGGEGNQRPVKLGRWAGPVRYRLAGDGATPGLAVEMGRFADRLEGLTGLRFVPADEEINFLILVTSPEERPIVSRELGRVAPLLAQSFDRWAGSPGLICVAMNLFDEEDGEIGFGLIMIGTELTPLMRTSCLHEEIVQALGLANDHAEVRPSIFNDDEEFALLTEHDEFLLRILYDRRLAPGMTAEEALPIARRIVRDLRPEGS